MIDLAEEHPLLKTTFKILENTPHFYPLDKVDVQLKEREYTGTEQWKQVVEADLTDRFDDGSLPLWRVSLLKGDQVGQVIFTFDHTIADGRSGAQLMNHLYRICAAKLADKTCQLTYDRTPPNFESLYRQVDTSSVELAPLPPIERYIPPEVTTWEMKVLNASLMQKLNGWNHAHGVKMNATLFAAFMLAVVDVLKPPMGSYEAVSMVDVRSNFVPPVSVELLRPLVSALGMSVDITKEWTLESLARLMHEDLHEKIAAKSHLLGVYSAQERFKQKPDPSQLLHSFKSPNRLCITNIGQTGFDGDYGDLKMKSLFFAGNVGKFYIGKYSATLGVTTFGGRGHLVLSYMKDKCSDAEAKQVLEKMEVNLSSAVSAS